MQHLLESGRPDGVPQTQALVRQRMLEPDGELGIPPVSDSMKNFSILHDAVRNGLLDD